MIRILLSILSGACVTVVLLVLCPMSVSARNILWGGQPNDVLVSSAGTPLTTSFLFEIGAFDHGFVPTAENLEYWQANWKVFDRAVSGDGWNAPVQWLSSVSNLKTDGTSQEAPPGTTFTFAEGEQGYLWAFNSQTHGFGSEWALITNNGSDGNAANDWLFPDPQDQSTVDEVRWQFPDASMAIIGGVNGVRNPEGGD